jgi:hypothetical protein
MSSSLIPVVMMATHSTGVEGRKSRDQGRKCILGVGENDVTEINECKDVLWEKGLPKPQAFITTFMNDK